MWFNSWEFLYFLPLVLTFYYIFSHRAQNIWLLIASYFFYGWWDWRFLLLIFTSTTVDYIAGLYIHYRAEEQKKRIGLYTSLIINLGILFTFKYFNFFIDGFIEIGSVLGLNFNTPILRLLPPVGISFYTFQTISYTIDIYNNKLKPTSNFIDFALFVSYFPQLVAGPIERAGNLLPRITKKRIVNVEMIHSGLLLILVGLFKKVVIADNAAIGVEEVFNNVTKFSTWMLWKGLYLFSIQIYCDFSGYSNIARGVSRLFGIELMENFQAPYLSKSITEFWRRWHISLSTWLRDYVYLPLNLKIRHSKFLGIKFSIFITFLLCGLWHGANWTFIIWGMLHGTYLAFHLATGESKLFNSIKQKLHLPVFIKNILLVLFIFHLVSFTWIFFRSESIAQAWNYILGLISFRGEFSLRVFLKPAVLIAFLLPLDLAQYLKTEVFAIRLWPRILKTAYYTIMIIAIILLSSNEVPFIYFQF